MKRSPNYLIPLTTLFNNALNLTLHRTRSAIPDRICRVPVPGLQFIGRTCYVLGPFRSRSYHVQADLARCKGERDPRNT